MESGGGGSKGVVASKLPSMHQNEPKKPIAYHIKSKTEFISGYFAACASITILYPLNKIIFRQILEGMSLKEAYGQLKQEGLNSLYRGLLPPLLQKSTSYSIMFGSQHEYYLWIESFLNDHRHNELVKQMSFKQRHFVQTAVSGALAGLTEASLTPLERVQALLQMQQYHKTFKHTWHAFREISSQYGVRELYRGMSAICLRNSLSNVMFFTSRTQIKSYFPPTSSKVRNVVYDFLNGGVLGAIISTLFYPLNVVKSHMQARLGGKHFGTMETLRMTFELKNRRIGLFYKGVGSNFMRAVLAWGITNSAYELILTTLKPSTSS